jgi:hypothetical protein
MTGGMDIDTGIEGWVRLLQVGELRICFGESCTVPMLPRMIGKDAAQTETAHHSPSQLLAPASYLPSAFHRPDAHTNPGFDIY